MTVEITLSALFLIIIVAMLMGMLTISVVASRIVGRFKGF